MKNRELLFRLTKKDFEIEWYNPKKPGGQNSNKHDNACRIRHPASGAVAQCQDNKERVPNKKTAFKRLLATKEFKLWHKLVSAEIMTGESIEEIVERAMEPQNLKFEVKEDGKWTEEKKDQ